ncbi:uracil-DNA glycosylase [Thalassoroseus pseudoceratinae]|uniref:uracil-DNA glycosylase n=1 Tax=Thalassoroseus pseudoceratinae TaxID=2713176 RepID=UPI001422A3B1|nr:uracil-DNA glycosylase [Thalassoroseus pseudoceratinae]
MNDEVGISELRQALRQQLESYRRAGLTHLPLADRVLTFPGTADVASTEPAVNEQAVVELPKVPEVAATLETPSNPAVETVPSQSLFGEDSGGTASDLGNWGELDDAERPAALAKLANRVAACVRCQELADTRRQTVFGIGNPSARLMFIGEAPGRDEDEQGEPFVGAAGQLLNRIIKACTLTREEIYICNILRCRPPMNRNPTDQEAANCREYLDGQIRIVAPEFIVCWGSVAARNLLGTKSSVGRLRQQFFTYGQAQVMCTYHPSYLLRNPSAKKDVWEDMQLLMRKMDIQLP